MDPFTFFFDKTAIITMPTQLIITDGVNAPSDINVDSLATTKPEFIQPIIAINKPIPPDTASFIFTGMEFTTASRTLHNDKIINIHYDKILYFETSKTIHKVIVHCENKKLEFYRKMKALEEILDDRFCRCHTSFIVNKDKIKEINKKDRIAHMINDEKCLISTRALKYLIKQ